MQQHALREGGTFPTNRLVGPMNIHTTLLKCFVLWWGDGEGSLQITVASPVWTFLVGQGGRVDYSLKCNSLCVHTTRIVGVYMCAHCLEALETRGRGGETLAKQYYGGS
jgi:hypothetical protein